MYEVHLDLDLIDPLPQYFHDWVLARWMGGGKTPDDLEQMPIHEVEEARIVMQAISQAEQARSKRR